MGGLRDEGLVVATDDSGRPIASAIETLRRRVALELVARGQGGALLAALALGERSGLEPAFRDAAARGGVAHLLAVSGLHLALVAGFAAFALRWAVRGILPLARWDGRRVAWAAALFVGAGYAMLTGAPLSMRRAFLFLLVLGIAGALRRPVTGVQRLSLAAAAVVSLDPAAVFDPGAQLSFSAAAALLLRLGRRDDEGMRARARALLGASSAAALATAPIAAFHFGTASPFGWIANAVAIPFTAVVLLPAALASAAIEAIGLEMLTGFVDLAAALGETSLAATEAWADWMPPAGVARPGAPGWIAVAVIAVWGVGRRSLRWRAAAAAACGAVLTWAPPAAVAPEPPRVVFFDVGRSWWWGSPGQGSSTKLPLRSL